MAHGSFGPASEADLPLAQDVVPYNVAVPFPPSCLPERAAPVRGRHTDARRPDDQFA
jgi:hypothetical protein